MPNASEPEGQLSLVPGRRAPRARSRAVVPLAASLPVARVAVDIGLAHLDRPFDYEVPSTLDADAQPGVRVRVRFSGKLVDGYVVGRAEESAHEGRLGRLDRVVSPVPVLSPEVLALARAVADGCAGTLADVLRLAVPPRHARAEAGFLAARRWDDVCTGTALTLPAGAAPGGAWEPYTHGPAYLSALQRAAGPRAVWAALPAASSPGSDWPEALAQAAAAARAGGGGVLVVVPDARDLARVAGALTASGDPALAPLVLTAELGPAERYRRFLAVRSGAARVVVGTRAAAFAPVVDLALVVIWDDGDDLHAEPRAPYPHVRNILWMRAEIEGCGLLIGGHAVTAEGASLVERGRAQPVTAPRDAVRAAAPTVRGVGDDAELARDEAARTARLPHLAWRTAREALESGPVLVQVPRRGYLPALSCQQCRAPARCATCHGPLRLSSGQAVAHCGWCGRAAGSWACPHCEGRRFRAGVVGSARTAEELGRAFPGVAVLTSGGDAVLDRVAARPALVVATPGAEPVADGGYAAALLLDAWALLDRPVLRAGEEALRRWLAAAALVRPGSEGGRVVVAADAGQRQAQALVRWDPIGAARRELADRRELGYPPSGWIAEVWGTPAAVEELLAVAHLPAAAEVLGPLPEAGRPDARADGVPRVRSLVRVPIDEAAAAAAALAAAQGVRSARKAADAVRVRVDPVDLA